MNKSILLAYKLLCPCWVSFYVCACIYTGWLEIMIIDGVFHPMAMHTLMIKNMTLQNSCIIALYEVNDFSHLYQLGDSEWLEKLLGPYFVLSIEASL